MWSFIKVIRKILKETKFKIEKEIFKKDNIVSFKNNIIINEWFWVIRSINSDNLTENWKTDLFDKNSYWFMPLITKDYIYIITKNWILFELLWETWIISRTGIVCDSVERNIIINVKWDQLIIAWLSYKNNLNSSLYFVKISDFSFIEIQLKGYISSELFYFNKKVYFWISWLWLSIYDNNSLFSYNIVWDIIWWFEVHKNNIYFSTTAGIVYIYNCINWLITNSKKISDYWIVSSPLVSNNKLYLTSVDKNLYILDLDLRINWLVKTNWRIISRPIKYKKYIIFWSNDSRLYFYNTEKLELSLSQFWERIVNSPIILNNNIFIQDFLNNIYSIDIKNYYLEKKQI